MRLIDADALKEKAINVCYEDDYESDGFGVVYVRHIDEAPTIDAEPVKHGEIIETIENGKMKRVFSCCNAACTQLTMWINPNYCPNCGAAMRERKDKDV